MLAAISATVTSLEMISFRENNEAILVNIVILAFFEFSRKHGYRRTMKAVSMRFSIFERSGVPPPLIPPLAAK